MRLVGWFLAVLLLLGGTAVDVSASEPGGHLQGVQGMPHDDFWRRTTDGWQRAEWLPGARPMPPRGPHPAVLGLFLALLSATALVGFSSSDARL